MEKTEGYRNTLKSAVCLTFNTICLLLMSILIAYIGRIDAFAVIGNIFIILFFIVSSIIVAAIATSYWLKGVKQYIDFRFQELEKEKSA